MAELTDAEVFGSGAPAVTPPPAAPEMSDAEVFGKPGPKFGDVPPGDVPARIRDAAYQAFTNAPSRGTEPGNMSVLSTGMQDWINRNIPGVGPYVINPLGQMIGTGIGAVAAGGAAAGQTVNELLSEAHLPPALQRDLNIAAITIPATPEAALATSAMANRPRLEAAGPGYAGGVTPKAMEDTQARQTVRSAFGPPPAPEPAPSSPSGIEGPRPPPPGYVAPQNTLGPSQGGPMTADTAKKIAGQYYTLADQKGGTLTPQFTDSFIDAVGKSAPQTQIGQAVAGESAVTGIAKALEDYRGQPMTLQAAQEIDEALTQRISKEYTLKGISKEGNQLADLQSQFRDRLLNAGPGDVAGGTGGFEALRTARQAWAAAMKLRDLEAIQQRASMTEQPSTSIRTQIRTILGNASKSRGYTDEELAALRDAADRGALGSTMHVFGGRLMPMIAAGFGLTHGGPVGALIEGAIAHGLGSGARAIASGLQARRLGRVTDMISGRVPPAPPPP